MKKNLPIIFIASLFLILASSVRAQLPVNSRSFIIIPPKLEITAAPGEVIQDVIRLQNQTNEEVTFSVGMSDFIVTNTQGSPVLVDQETAGEWALTQWLTLGAETLIIAPGEQGSLNFIISVPENAQPGGHYASIYFVQGGKVSPGQTIAEVAAEIRSLVLLRVKGPISKEALIRRFQAPRLSEYGPIELSTEITNLGNYHLTPIGAISIKNVFGKTVANLDLEERNIFPGASQEYQNLWNKKWLFGRYKATLTAAYGEQNLPLTATIFFWVWPWKITLIVIGIIILIILIIFMIKYLKKRREMKPEEIEEEEFIEDNEEEEEE
jgi:hypothetical protein